MSEQHLIVGLGNPGKDYAYTRHNIGFLVLENLAKVNGLKFSSHSWAKGLMAQGKIEGKDVILLMPLTFMNQSGIAVKQVITKKEISLDHLLVVVDDFHLDFGQLRLRAEGSDGGHNGLTSIVEHLKTKEFARLRFGIGSPRKKEEVVDYVLGEFNRQEKARLDTLISKAKDCCVYWVQEGTNQAMNQFNRREQDE